MPNGADPSQTHPSALLFADVSKSFGNYAVLRHLSVAVPRGEFFGLVGVNGAGKTTCIKALLDFCEIDAGRIEVFGIPATETRAREAVAFLPERFLPPYYLTGGDFLRYMCRLHRVSYPPDELQAMFSALDLQQDAAKKPVRDFSKGMAQKLGLAACFLSGRRLLVLDEPMSGLDPKARILVKRQLREKKERGHSLFFSTHMLNDVEDVCDRMGIMHEGELRFVGTPAECRAAYRASSLEQAFLDCISTRL